MKQSLLLLLFFISCILSIPLDSIPPTSDFEDIEIREIFDIFYKDEMKNKTAEEKEEAFREYSVWFTSIMEEEIEEELKEEAISIIEVDALPDDIKIITVVPVVDEEVIKIT
jgi:hypothetical protein